MCNLKPVGTNEKMKDVVTIIALVPRDLWWGRWREDQDNEGKGCLPRFKLCCLGPPAHDFKAAFL